MQEYGRVKYYLTGSCMLSLYYLQLYKAKIERSMQDTFRRKDLLRDNIACFITTRMDNDSSADALIGCVEQIGDYYD